MKNNIHYTDSSRGDLDEIWDYISFDLQNPTAAQRTVSTIMDAVEQLADFAEIGTPLASVISTAQAYRFLVVGNYLAFYRVQGRDVYIDRILYGRRDYLSILFGEMLDDQGED